jgi:peptide/nickel transport system substrate-binding protein
MSNTPAKGGKALPIVLAVLLVAAIIFGFTANNQKADLEKKVADLESQVTTLKGEVEAAKAEAAKVAEDAAKAAEEAAKALEEAAKAAEEAAKKVVSSGQIIYGSSTEISGDWAHGSQWTNNATDNMIRGLMNDYGTISNDQGGAMVENKSVTEKYETAENEDGTKTFTVKIAEDLVFNDGSPIDASHYVASLLLFNHPTLIDLGSKASGYLYYVGGEEYKANGVPAPELEKAAEGETEEEKTAREERNTAKTDEYKQAITDSIAKANAPWKGVRLIDKYTYALTVVEEKLPYFYEMSYAGLSPLSIAMWLGEGYEVKDDGEGAYFVGDMTKAALEAKIEKARFQSEGRVTAGPYNLVSYDVGAKQAVLEVNPLYKGNFEGQKPRVQKIIIVKAEDATQFDALKTGEINIISSLTGGDEINKALDLVKDPGGFDTVSWERAGYGKLMFQCDFGPTQFVAVRRAIAHLLNRPEFANTFTGGYGGLVQGPYGLALWQYKEAEEELEDRLNTYAYDPAQAVKLLEEDGWVLNEKGEAYTEGIRYKEVTAKEAGDYAHNVKVGDKILMPLIIDWSSSENNPVSELLVTMLANGQQTKDAGMEIRQAVMTFTDLLNWMYRDSSKDAKYGVPTYGMYNLASNFYPEYDQSYSWTRDPDKLAQGYNVNFLLDEQLDKLSMDMVYGVEAGDNEAYLKLWTDFIVRWNELLPEIPLYSNIYYTIFFDKLQGYEQSPFWGFEKAILYSWIKE